MRGWGEDRWWRGRDGDGTGRSEGGRRGRAYSAHDGVVVGQVRFAVLAAEDPVRGQVGVVFQPHGRAWLEASWLLPVRGLGGGCGTGPGSQATGSLVDDGRIEYRSGFCGRKSVLLV